MADQMGAPPPSQTWPELFRLYLQPSFLAPGILGVMVGATRLRGRTIMERLCYAVSGSLTVLALGPVIDPIMTAWMGLYGLPTIGAAHVGIFLIGTAGAEILSAIVAAIVARVRQLGGQPPR